MANYKPRYLGVTEMRTACRQMYRAWENINGVIMFGEQEQKLNRPTAIIPAVNIAEGEEFQMVPIDFSQIEEWDIDDLREVRNELYQNLDSLAPTENPLGLDYSPSHYPIYAFAECGLNNVEVQMMVGNKKDHNRKLKNLGPGEQEPQYEGMWPSGLDKAVVGFKRMHSAEQLPPVYMRFTGSTLNISAGAMRMGKSDKPDPGQEKGCFSDGNYVGEFDQIKAVLVEVKNAEAIRRTKKRQRGIPNGQRTGAF